MRLRLAIVLLFSAAPMVADLARDGSDKELMRLHALMKPQPDEVRWLEIDWKTDLWEARREAAKTGKPIYLWEMDGHPLGCT